MLYAKIIKRNEVATACNKKNRREGIVFYKLQDVCEFLENGDTLALLRIPKNAEITRERGYVPRYTTNNAIIKKVMPLSEVSTWKYLVSNGLDLTEWESEIILDMYKYLSEEAFQYLKAEGLDIYYNNHQMLINAAADGNIEFLDFLINHGLNIEANNGEALRDAVRFRDDAVIKYLISMGADIKMLESDDDISYALTIA